jgi:hypothetical protein
MITAQQKQASRLKGRLHELLANSEFDGVERSDTK